MSVEPIRSIKKIRKMISHMELKYSKRDALLFRMGINTILRVGDILSLRYCDVYDENGDFRQYLILNEQKTKKEKKVSLNAKIRAEIDIYCKHFELCSDDYMFFSFRTPEVPLDRIQAWRILKKAASECGIQNFGTHSMRKTLAYQIYQETKNLALVMHMLNHQSSRQTMRYIGINQDEMDKVYKTPKFQF